jgi:hypothetical protein
MKEKMLRILLSVCFLAGIVGCHHRGSASSEETLRQSFPVGTTKDQVERILTEKKIEHSFVEEKNAFYAIIRDTEGSSSLVKQSVQLVINLDDEKRVKEVRATKLHTGP